MEILNYKHNLSLELTEIDDWDALIAKLVRLPGKIAAVEASRLQVSVPISGNLEEVTVWNDEGSETSNFYHDCQKCIKEWAASTDLLFSPCPTKATGMDLSSPVVEYCLPIIYANSLLALIQFRLKPGENLSDGQMEIFENIRPEIALALKAGQEQKRLAEMHLTQTALAERRSLSSYLHDHLSQNLAYLCLKLDQFMARDEPFSAAEGRTEMQRMKDAANQSYDIVRGMIETIQPATTPHMYNLFGEHAKKISARSHIEISIEKKGEGAPLSSDIQRTVFYVFQEALNNIEKHAKADSVKVLVDRSENNLTVKISDNGTGFDSQNIDSSGHYGLGIMQERINKINGRIDIRSSPGLGTEVTIFVPIASLNKEWNA